MRHESYSTFLDQCLFRVSQLGAGKTQSLRRGERGSRDGEVGDLLYHVLVLLTLVLVFVTLTSFISQVGGSQELGGSKASLSTLGTATTATTGRRRERRKSDSASIIPDAQVSFSFLFLRFFSLVFPLIRILTWGQKDIQDSFFIRRRQLAVQ